MKTAKDFLRQFIDIECEVDESVVINTMKDYALEVAKETLKNVSENAMVESDGRIDEFFMFNGYVGDSTIVVSVNNDSILSEDNIPKEVKQ